MVPSPGLVLTEWYGINQMFSLNFDPNHLMLLPFLHWIHSLMSLLTDSTVSNKSLSLLACFAFVL